MKKTFIEVTDLPTDPFNALHQLRPKLVTAFNSAREHKEKLALLKNTLKFVYAKCTEFEKHAIELEEIAEEKAARKGILATAEANAIDLDERLSTPKLAEALEAALSAKPAEK